jgi:hypothetical protein
MWTQWMLGPRSSNTAHEVAEVAFNSGGVSFPAPGMFLSMTNLRMVCFLLEGWPADFDRPVAVVAARRGRRPFARLHSS